jgi:hypothetical protein
MLRKIGIISVLSLIVVALTASVAVAQNPQFKNRGGPFAEDTGLNLTVSGTLVGLGNSSGQTIEVVATGQPIVQCTNPSGSNQPPGQQPPAGTFTSGPVPIDPEMITRSGQYTFNVTTLDPVVPQVCRTSPGWSQQTTDVVFTNYQVIVNGINLGTFTNIEQA